MDDDSLEIVAQVLNDWFEKEAIPEDVLQARVALI